MPRLLLVDDNTSIHRTVVFLLASTDMEITYAQSATEVLGLIVKEEPFDLALIDVTMPEMDGWQLLARLRSFPKTASMPIAMMAGILEEIDSAQTENAPIQAFLRKPVDLHDLAEKLKNVMTTPVEVKTGTVVPSLVPGVVIVKDPIPDDLLVLEEADLAEDISATKQLPGYDMAPAPVGVPVPDAEEAISLDLEDLDLSNLDNLSTISSGFEVATDKSEQTDLSQLETPDYGESLLTEAQTESAIVNENNISNFLDALPDDFGNELLAKKDVTDSAQSQQMASMTQEPGQVPEGLFDALQREFELEPINLPGSSIESLEIGKPSLSSDDQVYPFEMLDISGEKKVALTLDEEPTDISGIASMLLSDSSFIESLAKAVAERLRCQGL